MEDILSQNVATRRGENLPCTGNACCFVTCVHMLTVGQNVATIVGI